MKKIILSAAMMIAAVSFASAQWFVGGSIGYSLDTEDQGNAKVKTSNYLLTPQFGYEFNDNWMVGLQFGYEGLNEKYVPEEGDKQTTAFRDYFVVNPFARYTAWYVGDFSLAFQGNVEFGFGNDKAFDYGLNIVPVLQYDLTPNVMLESSLNFAAIGFAAQQRGEGDNKTTDSYFGLTATGEGVDDLTDISLGFIVKF